MSLVTKKQMEEIKETFDNCLNQFVEELNTDHEKTEFLERASAIVEKMRTKHKLKLFFYNCYEMRYPEYLNENYRSKIKHELLYLLENMDITLLNRNVSSNEREGDCEFHFNIGENVRFSADFVISNDWTIYDHYYINNAKVCLMYECDDCDCWCSCLKSGKNKCMHPSTCLQKQYLCTPMKEPIQKAYSSFNFETLTLNDFFDFFLYISHFGKDECSHGTCVKWNDVPKFERLRKGISD